MHKKSLNNFICHLPWFKKLSPTHTHPLKTFYEFLKPYEFFFFWLRVTHKMLNVNCIKNHSIILSVTCHGLKNFPPLIHIPSKPFMTFWNPMSGMGWVIHGCGGVEWVIQGWGRVGHAVKQPKKWFLRIKIWPNQNQFWKGYKIQVLNIKIIFIIILLLQLCYIPNYIKKLLPDAPGIKNCNGIIITLVPREKSRKVVCVLNGTEMLSPKATTNKNFSHIIQKAVDNNLSEEKTETLTCDRWNYSQPTPLQPSITPHPTPALHHIPHPSMTHPTPPIHDPPHSSMTHPPPPWPTPPLHDPPHPSMTHLTHPWHTPPHPCMTHTTPVWPTHSCMTHLTPIGGAPFGRHAALRLFHFVSLMYNHPILYL